MVVAINDEDDDNDDVSRRVVDSGSMMVSNFRLALTARTSTFQRKLISYLYRVLPKVGIDNVSI